MQFASNKKKDFFRPDIKYIFMHTFVYLLHWNCIGTLSYCCYRYRCYCYGMKVLAMAYWPSFALWEWNGQSTHSLQQVAGYINRWTISLWLLLSIYFWLEPLIRVLISSSGRHGNIAEKMERKLHVRRRLTHGGGGDRIFWVWHMYMCIVLEIILCSRHLKSLYTDSCLRT